MHALRVGLSSGQSLDALRCAQDQHVCWPPREQAISDHARDMVKPLLDLYRIEDFQVVHIENQVAIVGRETLAQHRLSAKLHELTRHQVAGHGDHLDRQWEAPEDVDELALVGDTDELRAGLSNDFLTRERATTALD